jgi:hypothetical protein
MESNEMKLTDQLWELNTAQAQEVLKAFLASGEKTFKSLKVDGVDLDYSSESVIKLAHHVANEIKQGRLTDESQNIWFMRLGYYFGEALRKAMPTLAWRLGDPDYALANHPVLVGFLDDMEGPMVAVCRNMVRSVAEGRSQPERIDNGVRLWFGPTKLIDR